MRHSDDHTKMPRRLLDKPDALPSMYINDISKLFMHRIRRESERCGIPHGYHKLLMELAHNDSLTQLQLVKLTHLTAPTVSVALGKMEADGLVTRTPDPDDMRQIKVALTDRGREMDENVRRAFRETDALLTRGISEEQLEAVKPLLRQMLKNLLEEENA